MRTVHKYGLRFIEIFDFLSVLFLQNVKFPSLFCCYHFCFVLCSYQSERHGRTGAVEERSAAAAAAVVRTTQPSKSFLPSSTHVLKTPYSKLPKSSGNRKLVKQNFQIKGKNVPSNFRFRRKIPRPKIVTCATFAKIHQALASIRSMKNRFH